MKQTVSNSESTASLANVSTLSIDIGGTGLKASVLDRTGKMLVERAVVWRHLTRARRQFF